ncbi:hypothetical protein M5103_000537 [Vibrio alginolyticus]|nr:hypothetical protein [Vibrio parahaemolyticus]EJE8152867.1 hypothetical protein [Vibrio alginolyticus]
MKMNNRNVIKKHSGKKIQSVTDLPKFETINEAIDQTWKSIEILERAREKFVENQILARRLKRCVQEKERCNSLACNYCRRRFRIRKVNPLAARIVGKEHLWGFVTYIGYQFAFPKEELEDFNYQKFKNSLSHTLRRAGFKGPIFGNVEIDYHPYGEDKMLPHVHFLMLLNEANISGYSTLQMNLNHKIVKGKLKHIKPKRKPKPLHMKAVNSPYGVISYMNKIAMYKVPDFKIKGTKSRYRTGKKQRLPDELYCDSLHLLDSISEENVEFIFGIRRWND